jgi:glycosyltransferase involved in cell wall biosynthesis
MKSISFCSTVYNNYNTIEHGILSLIKAVKRLDVRYEIVVVDNFSSDGTYELLLRLRREIPTLKIIRKKCSRGSGRQLAFYYSSGDVIFPFDGGYDIPSA